MRRRQGYGHGRPLVRYPVEPNSGQLATPNYGAVQKWVDIPKQSEESLQNLLLPGPFDWIVIIPSPLSNPGNIVTTFLIGDGAMNSSTIAGTQNSGIIPAGSRMIIDGIFPYLEGNSGPIVGPRIPGNTATVFWSILINQRPAFNYGNITTILAPWNGMSERTLVSVRPGEQLTCSVTMNDPNVLFPFVGMRLKGEVIPIKKQGVILNDDVRGGR